MQVSFSSRRALFSWDRRGRGLILSITTPADCPASLAGPVSHVPEGHSAPGAGIACSDITHKIAHGTIN